MASTYCTYTLSPAFTFGPDPGISTPSMKRPVGLERGTNTVGSAPAVPAGDCRIPGRSDGVDAMAWVVVVDDDAVVLEELEQPASPSDATRAPAARRESGVFISGGLSR